MKNLNIGIIIKRIFMIILGSLITAISVDAFLVPHNLLSGGITGIALIINYIANIPVGMMVLILNIPLFIIGLRKIDKEFIAYSIIGTAAFSILVSSINPITNTIHINDTMLSAIAGGVSGGIGVGIVFRSRGSMGGSDIISWILYRKWGISVASFSFMVNIAVILGGVLFNGAGIEIVLYTLISMYTSSVVINKVIEGLNRRKLLLIITNEKERVSKALMTRIARGVTILEGEGGYTGDRKKIIYCFLTLTQVTRAKSIVAEADPRSFMAILDTSEIHGTGFNKRNI